MQQKETLTMAISKKSRKNNSATCTTLVKKQAVQTEKALPSIADSSLMQAVETQLVKRTRAVRRHPFNKKIFVSEYWECGAWAKLRYSVIEYATFIEAQEALHRNDIEFGPWQVF